LHPGDCFGQGCDIVNRLDVAFVTRSPRKSAAVVDELAPLLDLLGADRFPERWVVPEPQLV